MRFRVDVSDITRNLNTELEAELQQARDTTGKIALDFHRGVKRRTPVKTGNARNGWEVNLDGTAPIVENNVEYIIPLNRGHSKQAPSGFIEAELDSAMRRVRR